MGSVVTVDAAALDMCPDTRLIMIPRQGVGVVELDTDGVLASLPRQRLAQVAREHMLWGHLIDRALMPELIIAVDMDAMEPVAIDEWMGASPNYTARMRRLMGIDGDSVADIMKALQLDVGFVHEYMDVGYSVTDRDHGEFWLNHCGALVDVEPMGDQQVISMCHHIEDPTFDATALATNPKVRIRPVHRPPHSPVSTEAVTPVRIGRGGPAAAACHWTVVIDPSNPPVPEPSITGRVAGLGLCRAPLPDLVPTGDGLDDYRGELVPRFRLDLLSGGALRAVIREFAFQAHLIAAAGAMAIGDRHGAEIARSVSLAQGVGVAWLGAQRLARVLGGDRYLVDLARVLVVHPLWPSGVSATARVDDTGMTLRVHAAPGLLDPAAPGWLGRLADGEVSLVAAVANSLDPGVAVEITAAGIDEMEFRLAINGNAEPAPEPRTLELLHFSRAADWAFAPGTPL